MRDLVSIGPPLTFVSGFFWIRILAQNTFQKARFSGAQVYLSAGCVQLDR
jgi:hypothetical protein